MNKMAKDPRPDCERISQILAEIWWIHGYEEVEHPDNLTDIFDLMAQELVSRGWHDHHG